jgi:Txe/YoeB family toxin of Txe-Axe toxin-antitoxin module
VVPDRPPPLQHGAPLRAPRTRARETRARRACYASGKDAVVTTECPDSRTRDLRTPFEGLGQPGQLRHQSAGCWSRRLTEEHRLVYRVTADAVVVLMARYHY